MKSLLVFAWLLNVNSMPSSSFKINAHTDDFKSLVLNNDIFVDKTMLIEEFIRFEPNKNYIPLILRPRGWGKSTNMDMLRRFFEIEVDDQGKRLPPQKITNDKLFLGGEITLDKNSPPRKLHPLKISHLPRVILYMGKTPVILVKFENVTGKCYEEIEQSIKSRVVRAFQNHRYLLNYTGATPELLGEKNFKKCLTGDFNTTSLKKSLFILSTALYDFHGTRVVILVDDYDVPLINAYLEFGHRKKEYNKVADLLHSMYHNALKCNPFVFRGLITGVLKLALDTSEGAMIPKLDNLEVCTFFHPRFSHFFGFTRQEVKNMLERLPISADVDEMNSWYGGYAIDENIYLNGDLVMKSISHNGSMGFYEQSNVAGEALLDKILTTDRMQPKILSLISGKKLYFNNFMLWMRLRWEALQEIAVLFHAGFLNKTNSVEGPELAIPNKQIQQIYEIKSLQWVATKFGANSSEFVSFAECLVNGSMEQFRETLITYFGNASQLIQGGEKKAKAVYSAMTIALQTALSSSHEKIASDMADGFILIPKLGRGDVAIIFKYKISKKKGDMNFGAKSSFEEINRRLNGTDLKTCSQIRTINKIGLAFCGIQVAVKDQIENISNSNDTVGI